MCLSCPQNTTTKRKWHPRVPGFWGCVKALRWYRVDSATSKVRARFSQGFVYSGPLSQLKAYMCWVVSNPRKTRDFLPSHSLLPSHFGFLVWRLVCKRFKYDLLEYNKNAFYCPNLPPQFTVEILCLDWFSWIVSRSVDESIWWLSITHACVGLFVPFFRATVHCRAVIMLLYLTF